MFDWIKRSGIPTATQKDIEATEDAVMIVARVEDYDETEGNKFWSLEANKSYPRDGLVCFECQYPVVMSNGLYEAYQNNPHNPKAICSRCVAGFIKEIK